MIVWKPANVFVFVGSTKGIDLVPHQIFSRSTKFVGFIQTYNLYHRDCGVSFSLSKDDGIKFFLTETLLTKSWQKLQIYSERYKNLYTGLPLMVIFVADRPSTETYLEIVKKSSWQSAFFLLSFDLSRACS